MKARLGAEVFLCFWIDLFYRHGTSPSRVDLRAGLACTAEERRAGDGKEDAVRCVGPHAGRKLRCGSRRSLSGGERLKVNSQANVLRPRRLFRLIEPLRSVPQTFPVSASAPGPAPFQTQSSRVFAGRP